MTVCSTLRSVSWSHPPPPPTPHKLPHSPPEPVCPCQPQCAFTRARGGEAPAREARPLRTTRRTRYIIWCIIRCLGGGGGVACQR